MQATQHKRPTAATTVLACALTCIAIASGCTRSPYPQPGVAPYPPIAQAPVGGATAPPTGPQSVYAGQQTSPQLVQLQQQVQSLGTDNRQLTAQVAQLQQQNQALSGQNQLLTSQLQDSVAQYRKLAATSQDVANQARSMQASLNSRGGARLTANNSLIGSAAGIQIAGAQVVQDGQVIRIRLPADRLFSAGSAMVSPQGTNQLDQVATTILAKHPRQRVAVEGHTDAGQRYGGVGSAYKLAGEQAQAVLDQLVQRNRLPSRQLFVVNHGANFPLADNQSEPGRAANRRVEIVIYPDSF